MRTYIDCIPCFVRQTLDSVRIATQDEKVREDISRRVLRLCAEIELHSNPPAMAQKIHGLIHRMTGVEDPYLDIKNHCNKLALQMYRQLKERVSSSAKPLETAVRLAIAGNIIDFGVNSHLSMQQVEQTIAESLEAPLDIQTVNAFEAAVSEADRILYLGDNAGEIVFDRLLLEELAKEKITFVVKACPIINDATMEDAQITGLTDIVRVIDNGSAAPGTILEDCSPQFRRRFDEADLIIAKGQGNYETLSDVEKDIFFVLKAKCRVAARHLGCNVGDLVLVRSKVRATARER